MLWELQKGYYRIFQGGMKIAALVLPFPVPKLISGAGSVKQLASHVKEAGVKHALLVTDKSLMRLKLPESLMQALDTLGVKVTVYDAVEPNPTIDDIEAGLRAYIYNKCDGIVAFGGGSPIDCAKVIGARAVNRNRSVKSMRGLFKVIFKLPPFFAVPTTAGTGSETTVAAVVTDSLTHEKFAINDLRLVPDVAVLDPELMVGLPPFITATTGMDALTHAVEAYIGLNGNAFTDKNAEDATKLIFENLEKVYHHPDDLDARNQMALASFYAGSAFTRAYVGYVHAIAHNMGGLYGVGHGLANAVIMPYVLDFCRQAAEKKLAKLAIVASLGNQGDDSKSLSKLFIAKIREMNRNMGIPDKIAELRKEDIPLIAQRALKEAHPEYPVPRIMTKEECETLVARLLP